MGKKENSKKGKIMTGISQNVSTFRYSVFFIIFLEIERKMISEKTGGEKG